jgi:hypothetical protein
MNKDCELEDEEGELVEVTASSAIYMAPKSGDDSLSKSQKTKAQLTYQIAKAPSVCNASISKIINEYCATSFLPALLQYLKSTVFSSPNARPVLIN